MLGGLGMKHLAPTGRLADRIFSCMLCGACKNVCPAGIDVPEMIYDGRTILKKYYSKGRFLRRVLKLSASNMGMAFGLLRLIQKVSTRFDHIPEVASKPFNKQVQLFKNINKIGRVALFAGCSVNYLYPELGETLSKMLLQKGYEVVVFNGESCCGAPFRSMGLEKEATELAKKNIEHFNKVRAEAIISMCPTCTMVIKEQYPVLAGTAISNIVDVNEFLIQSGITSGLETDPSVVTYHDPCHLRYGLNVTDEPRQILRGIKGLELVEMDHADDCCGFAGLFSLHYKDISSEIGTRKNDNILRTSADTVVTSCPGCIMQLKYLMRKSNSNVHVKHIVEVIDEAITGY